MINIFKDREFGEMLAEYGLDLINLFVASKTPFAILCNLNEVEFKPDLPNEIASTFRPLTLFAIEGYTLSTTKVDWENGSISFEAGFGKNNIASIVTVSAAAVMNIAVDDTVVFINPTATQKRTKKVQSDASEEKSLKSFLNNPENSKFFK